MEDTGHGYGAGQVHDNRDLQISGFHTAHVVSNDFSSNLRPPHDHTSLNTIVSLPPLGSLSPGNYDGMRASLNDSARGECRYRCLDPLLPYLDNVISIPLACELFEVYLIDPGTSFFRCASPYILTRIFRKKSLLHPTNPRPMSPVLLATILWCCVQTAEIPALLVPGTRSKLIHSLYDLATTLVAERDPDRYRRIHGGVRVEKEGPGDQESQHADRLPPPTDGEKLGTVDDVLTFLLLCIGVSAGDFKSDSLKWWSKAARLAMTLGLNVEDSPSNGADSRQHTQQSLAELESQEERRRVFWLLYSLDRHLSLSYNGTLHMPDCRFDVYGKAYTTADFPGIFAEHVIAPLPESAWENLDEVMYNMPPRTLGLPTNITGAGYFEYFLPLMSILGDIIEAHHLQNHPRLGKLDYSETVETIARMIDDCEASLECLARELDSHAAKADASAALGDDGARRTPHPHEMGHCGVADSVPYGFARDTTHFRLVIAYSTHILHVLRVLLHGKWDAISMLDNEDDWITTPRFVKCASHAIAASQAVSEILTLDPELTFMPYLFGIYLLHGSFILLLFADRMPQVGQNRSVEQACETIVRAHEVCVVTLSTEFQVSVPLSSLLGHLGTKR
jgi:hypothetical protein